MQRVPNDPRGSLLRNVEQVQAPKMRTQRGFCRVGSLQQKLILLACAFGVVLFWRYFTEQSRHRPWSTSSIGLPSNFRLSKVDLRPQWTWVCRNDRCERTLASETTKLQSFPTCSMLCASLQLWPLPSGPVNLATAAVPIRSDEISLAIDKSPSQEVATHLKDAFALMKEDLKLLDKGTNRRNNVEKPRAVIVHISVNGSGDPRLLIDTDESYKLYLRPLDNSLVADISAQTFCGARHGLETLFQLVWMDPYAGSLLILESASVQDAPIFKYRGLLLDTARNYFPVKDIIRTIDAMGAVKMNTFHWHISDSQSFPLKLNSAPQLAQHGAYGPEAIYTPEDVRAIVRRARLRGVRVLIEVDAPAHVGRAWTWGPQAGFGHLAHCVEAEPWYDYCGEPPCGQLNPKNPHVYEVLERIYAEVIQLTGVDDIFHLGGDEVSEYCWNLHFNETDPMELWLEFTRKALLSLKRANGGKLPELTLLWSSGLTNTPYLEQLDMKKVGIQIWGAAMWPESQYILDAGFRTILSHVEAWYLDCGFGSWRDTNSEGACTPYRTWQVIYEHRPWVMERGLDPSMRVPGTAPWRIEGGTACQWSEQLGPEGLDERVWPRTAALAERLWSDPSEGATADVYIRLDMMRSRLLAKGVRAAPLWPRWCSDNPNLCLNPPTTTSLPVDPNDDSVNIVYQ